MPDEENAGEGGREQLRDVGDAGEVNGGKDFLQIQSPRIEEERRRRVVDTLETKKVKVRLQ